MIITETISKSTRGRSDIIDITGDIEQKLADTNITDGIVNVFVAGSTAGLTTIEYESGLISDFTELWERIAPENISYDHNERWGDGNGFSHVRASLLGPSLTIPFKEK